MAAKLPAKFQQQAVIQSGYQDGTKELWSEIWNTLMGYINADDSPNKLHQKDVLVGKFIDSQWFCMFFLHLALA